MTWFYTHNCVDDPIYIGHDLADRYAMRVEWPTNRRLHWSIRLEAQRAEAKAIVAELNKQAIRTEPVLPEGSH